MKLDIWQTRLLERTLEAVVVRKRQNKNSIQEQLEADSLEKAASALRDGETLEPS